MSSPVDDPSQPSDTRHFPVAGFIGVFVAVVVLALAFVACGVTRRRQQRQRAQIAFNHQQFYAQHHRPQPSQSAPNPQLNKALPNNKPLPGQSGSSDRPNFGLTTNVYSTYSSGGGPPVFSKNEEMGPPPPAYEARSKGNQNAAVVSAIV